MIRLLAALLLLAASPAFGHAVLLETSPADGATLTEAPAELVLHFNEPVTPVVVTLVDRTGAAIPGFKVRSVDTDLHMDLPRLERGSYIASWRVTSADSHPVAGAISFGVGEVPPDAAVPAGGDGILIGAAARWLLSTTLVGAAGGGLFALLVAAPRRRFWLSVAALAGGASALLMIGVEGALLTGTGPAGLLDPALWRVGMDSTRGTASLVALAAMILLAWGTPARRVFWGGGAGLAILSFALTGHAASAPPPWLAAPMVALHLLAVAFWLGALLPLAVRLADEPRPATLVARFSGLAGWAIVLLLASGLALAILQVERPAALIETDYGRLLLAKLAVVAAMLALGALNRWRLLPALRRNLPGAASRAASRLGRSVRVEILLGLAVLGLAAMLGTTPPPRTDMAMHQSAEEGRTILLTDPAGRTALLEIAADRVTVRLLGPDGAVVVPREAVLRASLPAAGIGPLERILAIGADGSASSAAAGFSPAGRWHLSIELLVDDFTKAIFESEVELP